MKPLIKHFFPNNEAFSYEVLRAAGYSNFGGADIGEICYICSKIRSGNEADWLREWQLAAERAVQNAKISASCGNTQSAVDGYLRASNYFRTAEFFRRADPLNDAVALSLSEKACTSFATAMKSSDYNYEEVVIPFQTTTLPGYIVSLAGPVQKRPLIIFNGGYDSTKEEAWFAIGAAALQRGYNLLAFDGPGQGMALRKQGLFFRPDWEQVLTPVMDYAMSRGEVASNKIVVFGWSMGGFLVARAATMEHRAAALVLDDGVFDFGSAFRAQQPLFFQYLINRKYDFVSSQILELMKRISTGNRWGLLNGKWTFGAQSEADFLRKVNQYTLEGCVDQIKTSTLILDAPDDHFLKGQPALLNSKLSCSREFVSLKRDEGASTHCHQGAFGRLHQVIFDYLARNMERA